MNEHVYRGMFRAPAALLRLGCGSEAEPMEVGLYACGDGSEIPQSDVCDGRDDCEDASDEASCD